MKISPNLLSLLIFDLDGVITSEARYWHTARLTTWQLVTQPDFLGLTHYFGSSLDSPAQVLDKAEQVISPSFIAALKARAINSNWDLTFFVICLHLIGLLSQYASPALPLLPVDQPAQAQLQVLGRALRDETTLATPGAPVAASQILIDRFWAATQAFRGSQVTEFIPHFAQQVLGYSFPLLQSGSDLWQLCYGQFQAWYEGTLGFVLPEDETALPLEAIHQALDALSTAGRYTLAIATGRPRNEVIVPLRNLGLLSYFAGDRIVTYDDVLAAEAVCEHQGKPQKLGKPHPFVLYRAIYPELPITALLSTLALTDSRPSHPTVAYIGDAASDIVAAQQAGCFPIGVLTGFTMGQSLQEKQGMFRDLGCPIILDSIQALPQWLQETSGGAINVPF